MILMCIVAAIPPVNEIGWKLRALPLSKVKLELQWKKVLTNTHMQTNFLRLKRRDNDTNGLQRKDQPKRHSIQSSWRHASAPGWKSSSEVSSNQMHAEEETPMIWGSQPYLSSSWAGLAPGKHRRPSWVDTPPPFGWSGARPTRLGCVILHNTVEELHKRLQSDEKYLPSSSPPPPPSYSKCHLKICLLIWITVKGEVGGGGCLLEPLQVCYSRVSFLRLLATLEPPKGVHNTRLHGYDWERHVCNLGSRAAYTPILLKLWKLVPTSLQSLRSFSIVPTHPFIQCIIIMMLQHCAYLLLLLQKTDQFPQLQRAKYDPSMTFMAFISTMEQTWRAIIF